MLKQSKYGLNLYSEDLIDILDQIVDKLLELTQLKDPNQNFLDNIYLLYNNGISVSQRNYDISSTIDTQVLYDLLNDSFYNTVVRKLAKKFDLTAVDDIEIFFKSISTLKLLFLGGDEYLKECYLMDLLQIRAWFTNKEIIQKTFERINKSFMTFLKLNNTALENLNKRDHLSSFFCTWGLKNGFKGTVQLKDMLSISEFLNILKTQKLIIDFFDLSRFHGTISHAFQWYLIVEQYKQNPNSLINSPLAIYSYLGEDICRFKHSIVFNFGGHISQIRRNTIPTSSPSTAWDPFFDMEYISPESSAIDLCSPDSVTYYLNQYLQTLNSSDVQNFGHFYNQQLYDKEQFLQPNIGSIYEYPNTDFKRLQLKKSFESTVEKYGKLLFQSFFKTPRPLLPITTQTQGIHTQTTMFNKKA